MRILMRILMRIPMRIPIRIRSISLCDPHAGPYADFCADAYAGDPYSGSYADPYAHGGNAGGALRGGSVTLY